MPHSAGQRGKLAHVGENAAACPQNPAPSPSLKIKATLQFDRGLMSINNKRLKKALRFILTHWSNFLDYLCKDGNFFLQNTHFGVSLWLLSLEFLSSIGTLSQRLGEVK